ncbi:hypothetical protein NDU88_006099, partial [Pleurodeles waltl]
PQTCSLQGVVSALSFRKGGEMKPKACFFFFFFWHAGESHLRADPLAAPDLAVSKTE